MEIKDYELYSLIRILIYSFESIVAISLSLYCWKEFGRHFVLPILFTMYLATDSDLQYLQKGVLNCLKKAGIWEQLNFDFPLYWQGFRLAVYLGCALLIFRAMRKK
jgi:hypothetical protein